MCSALRYTCPLPSHLSPSSLWASSNWSILEVLLQEHVYWPELCDTLYMPTALPFPSHPLFGPQAIGVFLTCFFRNTSTGQLARPSLDTFQGLATSLTTKHLFPVGCHLLLSVSPSFICSFNLQMNMRAPVPASPLHCPALISPPSVG